MRLWWSLNLLYTLSEWPGELKKFTGESCIFGKLHRGLPGEKFSTGVNPGGKFFTGVNPGGIIFFTGAVNITYEIFSPGTTPWYFYTGESWFLVNYTVECLLSIFSPGSTPVQIFPLGQGVFNCKNGLLKGKTRSFGTGRAKRGRKIWANLRHFELKFWQK